MSTATDYYLISCTGYGKMPESLQGLTGFQRRGIVRRAAEPLCCVRFNLWPLGESLFAQEGDKGAFGIVEVRPDAHGVAQ